MLICSSRDSSTDYFSARANNIPPYETGLGEKNTNRSRLSGKGKQKRVSHDKLPEPCRLRLDDGSYMRGSSTQGFELRSHPAYESVAEPSQQIRRIR